MMKKMLTALELIPFKSRLNTTERRRTFIEGSRVTIKFLNEENLLA
jgi:hypothetical protein